MLGVALPAWGMSAAAAVVADTAHRMQALLLPMLLLMCMGTCIHALVLPARCTRMWCRPHSAHGCSFSSCSTARMSVEECSGE
jgi:hypothetical protein